MALGDYMGASCHACIGGTNVRAEVQKLQLEAPHIIVGTPGRVFDMLNRRYLCECFGGPGGFWGGSLGVPKCPRWGFWGCWLCSTCSTAVSRQGAPAAPIMCLWAFMGVFDTLYRRYRCESVGGALWGSLGSWGGSLGVPKCPYGGPGGVGLGVVVLSLQYLCEPRGGARGPSIVFMCPYGGSGGPHLSLWGFMGVFDLLNRQYRCESIGGAPHHPGGVLGGVFGFVGGPQISLRRPQGSSICSTCSTAGRRWGAPHMAPCVPMGVSGGPRVSLWGSHGSQPAVPLSAARGRLTLSYGDQWGPYVYPYGGVGCAQPAVPLGAAGGRPTKPHLLPVPPLLPISAPAPIAAP